MLTPPQHLILLLVFLGVHVPDLDTDVHCGFSRLPGWTRQFFFYCGLFRLPNLDTPKLTTDILIWNGAQSGCDRSVEDAYTSAAPDPILAIVGGPCCPILDFVIAFRIMITFYTLLTSLFCMYTSFKFVMHKCYLIVSTSDGICETRFYFSSLVAPHACGSSVDDSCSYKYCFLQFNVIIYLIIAIKTTDKNEMENRE
jgi:hypothetical protein